MTLAELREKLALYIGLDSATSDGLVLRWADRLLNDAADEIALRYRIPRGEVLIDRATATSPYTMPTGTLEVLRVVAEPDVYIPVMSFDDYQGNGTPSILPAYGVVVAVDSSSPPKLYIFTEDDTIPNLKVTYRAKHAMMVGDGDQPWNGQYSQYHVAIAARAALTALLSLDPGEQETMMRYKRANDIYNEVITQMSNDLDRVLYGNPPNWVKVVSNRRGWRI